MGNVEYTLLLSEHNAVQTKNTKQYRLQQKNRDLLRLQEYALKF